MKELHKRLLALGMGAVMIFAMGAAGCNSGNQGQTPSSGTTTPDPDKDKEPDDSPLPEMKTLEDAKTEFDAFVDRLATGKNFTYVLKSASQNVTTQFAGNKAKSDRNGEVYYLTEENGENFVIGLEDDNAWHKKLADEKMSIDYALSTMTDLFDGITWTAFDKNSNLLSGNLTMGNAQVDAEANFDKQHMSLQVKNGTAATEVGVHNIGTTTITLPENVIDETAENNNIFMVENGETIWNVKAIKEVLEPWLKNEGEGNQYGKDVAAKMRGNDNYLTREIVYINPEKDKMSFGMIYDVNGQLRFGESYFLDTYLYENLLNKPLTKMEFKNYLMQVDARRIITSFQDINVEYTTHDKDFEYAHGQEFETLTKNCFERLATIGAQRNNLSDKGEIVKDFEGAKVLFGLKTPTSDIGLSPDMGNVRTWHQYYLCEKNGNLQWIDLWLMGKDKWDSWNLSAMESVMQDKNNAWRILSLGRQDIAKENANILSDPIMTIGKSLSKE